MGKRKPQTVWVLAIASLLVVCRAGAAIAQETQPKRTTTRNLRAVRNLEDDNVSNVSTTTDNIASSLPTLVFNYGIIPPKYAFPLQRCEGNCKHDDQVCDKSCN